jgi:hypothetical protein
MMDKLKKSDETKYLSGVLGVFLVLLTSFSILTYGVDHGTVEVKVHENIEFESELEGKPKGTELIRFLWAIVSATPPSSSEQYTFPDYASKNHRLLKLVILPSRAPPIL